MSALSAVWELALYLRSGVLFKKRVLFGGMDFRKSPSLSLRSFSLYPSRDFFRPVTARRNGSKVFPASESSNSLSLHFRILSRLTSYTSYNVANHSMFRYRISLESVCLQEWVPINSSLPPHPYWRKAIRWLFARDSPCVVLQRYKSAWDYKLVLKPRFLGGVMVTSGNKPSVWDSTRLYFGDCFPPLCSPKTDFRVVTNDYQSYHGQEQRSLDEQIWYAPFRRNVKHSQVFIFRFSSVLDS